MNQTNMFNDFKAFVASVPQVTRYLTFATLAFSLGSKVGLCSVYQLALLTEPIYTNFQVWRLITAHLYSSGQGLIWHLYLLYTNSRDLEQGHFGGKRADYVLTVIILMFCIDMVGLYLQFPLLADAFGMGITYIYSQIRAQQTVSFMFGLQFKAMYLPYVLLAWVFYY
jgi:hypothetical protein